jgi:hypothetical protein
MRINRTLKDGLHIEYSISCDADFDESGRRNGGTVSTDLSRNSIGRIMHSFKTGWLLEEGAFG